MVNTTASAATHSTVCAISKTNPCPSRRGGSTLLPVIRDLMAGLLRLLL